MNTVKNTEFSKFLEESHYSEDAQIKCLNSLLFHSSKDMVKIYSSPKARYLAYENKLEITEEKHTQLKDMLENIISIQNIQDIKVNKWVDAFIEKAKEIQEPKYVTSLDHRHKMLCLSIEQIRTSILGI